MKVLIPVNFSELSDYTMGIASKMSKQIDVEVHAINVIDAPDDSMLGSDGRTISAGCMAEEVTPVTEELKKQLQEWTNKYKLKTLPVVMSGDRISKIINYIEGAGIDLVLVGTHGSKGFKEFLEGSQAEKLVRLSPAPVISIKSFDETLNLKQILLASELVKHEHSHLEALKELQAAFDAHIWLAKINTPKNFDTTRHIKRKMTEYIEEHNLQNVTPIVYNAANIEEGIRDFVEDYNIDLVAIGDHGYTGIKYIFHKSVSKDVVNHINHPVLTFKIDPS